MEIVKLLKETYAGKSFTVKYQTNGYYEIRPEESGFRMKYQPLARSVEKSFRDCFFSEWLENPAAFGAFENGQLLGFVEGTPETWNNRYRISNICVFDGARRHCGIGTILMDTILCEAEKSGARMVVLETQTCNENAISFYRKNGFEIIGFDLYAYTNSDPEQHEVRLEMGKKLVIMGERKHEREGNLCGNGSITF